MSFVPLWRPLLALPLAGLLGSLVLARAQLSIRPAELLVRGLLGMALLAALTVHPALGLGLAALTFGLTARAREIREREQRVNEQPVPAAEPMPVIALASIVVVALVAALRPPVPLFWDESVWLTKARVACAGPSALMSHALDPSSELAPRGYPIVAGVIQACFALGDASLSSLVAGGAALVVASFALFALLLARGTSGRTQGATLFVLAATPLVWVHLRSVQLDLPIGLLAAAFLLAVERVVASDPVGLPAAITAGLLLGIKDEGLACAVAVTVAVIVVDRRQSRVREAAVAGTGALTLATLAYRIELWLAGSANDDHSIGQASLGALPDLAREALRHAVDLRTWGVVPPLGVAAVVLGARRTAPLAARRAALAILGTLVALTFALVVGPSQVRDFALEGTLLNRLGLELLPLAAVLVPRAIDVNEGAR